MTQRTIVRANGSRRVTFSTGTETKVEQHHKDMVDVNNIVERYRNTGLIPQRARMPSYGDFTHGQDFLQAQIRIKSAEADFASLPPDIRLKFNNDPGQLITYINDPENAAEARVLGLLPSEPQGTPEDSEGHQSPVRPSSEASTGVKPEDQLDASE